MPKSTALNSWFRQAMYKSGRIRKHPSFLIPISDKLKKFDSSKYAYIKSTIDLSELEDDISSNLIKDCNNRFIDNYENEAIEYYKTIGKKLYIHNIYISEIFDADKNWLVYKIILILNGVFISDIIKKEKLIKLNSI